MKPINSYLIEAAYKWITDSQDVPQIHVNATMPNVNVPQHLVQNGEIIFNISMNAVTHLNMDEDGISFNARFNGKPENVYVPTYAILAIFARDSKAVIPLGIMEPPTEPEPETKNEDKKPGPQFRVV